MGKICGGIGKKIVSITTTYDDPIKVSCGEGTFAKCDCELTMTNFDNWETNIFGKPKKIVEAGLKRSDGTEINC